MKLCSLVAIKEILRYTYRMKTYQLGLYEKAIPDAVSCTDKLMLAKQQGYDYLEISIDESDAKLARLTYSPKQMQELLDASIQSIPMGSMCLSGHRRFPLGSEKTAQRSLDIMEQALHFAAFMGIPIIQLAGYDVYYEESTAKTRALFTENLHTCANLAAKYGIILAFETMETAFMNTVEKALEFVKIIDSPYLQIYPDLGNIVNAAYSENKDPAKDLLMGAGHIVAVHIKESLPGKFREIPYGTGHVDFPHLLDTCWNLGVRRYVTEFWHNSANDWKQQIVDSYDFIMSSFFANT